MNKYIQIIFLATTLLLSGCVNDDSDNPVPVKPSRREWYQLVKTDTISSQKMVQEIIDVPITALDITTIVRYSFLYHSINGSDTLTLSGAVCWPLGIKSCSEIWLDSHFFCTHWDECPSQKVEPVMLVSSRRNAIYIGADYQGLGLSRNLDMPYLNTPMLANQNIDCFKAAMTLLKDYGPYIADDYHTYNVGYSLGGAVSMGVARQIELDPGLKETVHLKKTISGNGPFDQTAYFNHCLKATDMELDFPVAILCAVKSIINSSPSFRQTYGYSDCFTDKLLKSGVLRALDSREYDTGAINSILIQAGCSSLKGILSTELLDRNSDISKAVFKELEKLDLTSGWTPQTPILVSHSKTDTYVPYACMESVIANLYDKNNPNVDVEIIESGAHVEQGAKFYVKLFYNLYPLD